MTKRVLILVSLLSASISLIFAASEPATGGDASSNGKTVVATVDGVPITLGEFEQKRPSALFQARNTFYEAEKKAVDDYLTDYLLERQAQKENLTVSQLLEKHVNGTIAKDPDDAALKVYFEGLDTKDSFETTKPKILDHLRERRLAKAKATYIESLRSEAKISIDVAPPRVEVSLKDAPVRGTANAPLMLIEFADYECPYCQQIQPDLTKLEAEFKGKLNFAYKDVPLPMHGHAQKAAEAAHCAGLQNKYWEYHDLLYSGRALDVPQLKDEAKGLGLDTAAFNACLDSGKEAGVVKASLSQAESLGLSGTPSFFLNGRFFSGVMSYEQMRSALNEELKALPQDRSQPAGQR